MNLTESRTKRVSKMTVKMKKFGENGEQLDFKKLQSSQYLIKTSEPKMYI